MADSNMDTLDHEMALCYADCDMEISLTQQLTDNNNLSNNYEDGGNSIIAEDEEYETEDVIIKEEFEIGEEGIMNTNSLSHSLECLDPGIPIVYTKRLDDMTIFKKKIKNESFSNIVQKVIRESKPNLKKTFNFLPERKPTINERQFSKLENKILKLNELAILNVAPSENTVLDLVDDVDSVNVVESVTERKPTLNELQCFKLEDKSLKSNKLATLNIAPSENTVLDLVDDVDSLNVVESVPDRKPTLNELQCFKLKDKSLKSNNLVTLNIAPSENTIDLVDDVDSVNVVKSVHSDDSEEDMPLKVLSSIKTEYVDLTVIDKHVKKDTNELFKLCKTCCVPLLANRNVSYINGKPFLIYGCTKKAFIKGLRYTAGVDFTYISFRNFKKNKSQVYKFEKKALVHREYDHIVALGLNVDECCYNNRENVIKSLICPSNMTPDLLRIPHRCPKDRCKCCCKPIANYPEKITPTSSSSSGGFGLTLYKFVETKRKNGTGHLNANKPNNTMNQPEKNDLEAILPKDFDYIHKALSYTPKSYNDSSNDKEITDLPDVDDRLGIKVLKDYSEMVEFYKFTLNGKNVKYIQMDSLVRNVKNNSFRNDIKECTRSDIVLCCWHKCDELIRSFDLKRIPTVRQFVRTRHPCPPDNCICCCKPNLPQPVHKEEPLKPASNHATNYTSMIKKRCKFLAKREESKPNQKLQENNLYDYESIILPQLVSQHRPKQTLSSPKTPLQSKEPTQSALNMPRNNNTAATIYPNLPQINNTAATIYPNLPQINNTAATIYPNLPQINNTGATINQNLPQINNTGATITTNLPQITYTVATTKPNMPKMNKRLDPTNNPSVSLDNNTSDSTVNLLVNSILQRFSDVRLTITPDGNVTAELNTPVHTLSTMELQILSSILNRAKQQVAQLKAKGHWNPEANTQINPIGPMNLANLSDNTAPATTPDKTKSKASVTEHTTKTNNVSRTKVAAPSLNKKTYYKRPIVPDRQTRQDAFQCYTNISALKMKEYLASCKSLLGNLNQMPKIKHVFSKNPCDQTKVNNDKAKTNVNHPIINTSNEQSKTNNAKLSKKSTVAEAKTIINTTNKRSKNNNARPSKTSKVAEANTSSTEGQVKRKNAKENVKSNKNISGPPTKRRKISRKINILKPTVSDHVSSDHVLTIDLDDDDPLNTAVVLPPPCEIVPPGRKAPILSNLLSKPEVPPGAPNTHPNLMYAPVPVVVPSMPVPGMPIPRMPMPGMPIPRMPMPGMPIPRMPMPGMSMSTIPIPSVPDVPIDATDVELIPDVQNDPITATDTTIADDDCILGF
ncbi:uncharacterized protein LOC114354299 [Ostrinia furnacalis]|uniref:uncharacterized protein LOC114354299 n=1 Tax=Ostrinia furnacalis TaxID=93504 RepID=UPI00103D7341|nr:uncharacterized protein LOC114354299 [Ostrinia furnacalis]